MNRQEPEQLNNQPAESEEYSLEEIIREFGGQQPAAEEPPAPKKRRPLREKRAEKTPEEKRPDKTPPEKKAPRREKKRSPAEEAPKKATKSCTDDTVIFEPIRTEKEAPEMEAPMKIATPGKMPSARMPGAGKSERPRKRTGREKKAVREKKKNGEIRECTPPSARLQLKNCRKGLGVRCLRIYLLSLPVLAGLFLILYQECGWTFLPFTEQMGAALPIILLAASVLLAWDVFYEAVKDLLRLRIGLHTLTVAAVILSVIDALSRGEGATYCPIAALLLFFQLRALHADRVSQFHTLRTACSFETPMGIFDTSGSEEKADTLRRDAGKTEEFLEKLKLRSMPQKVLRIYSSAMLVLTPALSFLLSGGDGTEFAGIWLLLLLGAVPCGAALSYVKPFATIAKKLAPCGGALCGWHGAKIFGGRHTILISDQDLFPQKNITSNGMKIYGGYQASRIIAYALAALRQVDSPLVSLFETLLAAQFGREMTPGETRVYEAGGVGEEIGGDIVLVGSLSFMRSMGVHMPAGTRVRQAVYVSVNGELAGIFAVRYKPSNSTRAGLRNVLSNRNFSLVLATRDFLISPELIAAKYELPADALKFPVYSKRLELAAQAPRETDQQGALIAKDTFGAFGVTVAAGRTLKICSGTALWLNLFAGILGFLLCGMLLAWDAVAVASPLHIAAFQLLWAFLSGVVTFVILRL